jgi:hypothetical protein
MHVVVSTVGLFIYLPAAVLLRPLWQEIRSPLNIKALPAFLLLKSVLQVFLVILSKTAKQVNQIAHACVFMGCIAALLVFSLRFTCYGYKRTQLWHLLSLIALIWSTIISLISTLLHASHSIILIAVLMSGWGAIVLFGVIYQLLRAPSLLYRKKAVDTRPLFRFAFKFATTRIMKSLILSFEAVNHRNRIISARRVNPAANRYEIREENLASEAIAEPREIISSD